MRREKIDINNLKVEGRDKAFNLGVVSDGSAAKILRKPLEDAGQMKSKGK